MNVYEVGKLRITTREDENSCESCFFKYICRNVYVEAKTKKLIDFCVNETACDEVIDKVEYILSDKLLIELDSVGCECNGCRHRDLCNKQSNEDILKLCRTGRLISRPKEIKKMIDLDIVKKFCETQCMQDCEGCILRPWINL